MTKTSPKETSGLRSKFKSGSHVEFQSKQILTLMAKVDPCTRRGLASRTVLGRTISLMSV